MDIAPGATILLALEVEGVGGVDAIGDLLLVDVGLGGNILVNVGFGKDLFVDVRFGFDLLVDVWLGSGGVCLLLKEKKEINRIVRFLQYSLKIH